MLNKLNYLFSKELNLIKQMWLKHSQSFKQYWIFVLVTVLIGFFGMYFTLHFLNVDLKDAATEFGKVSKVDSVTTNEDSYWEGAIQIFSNNWKVCLQVLILAFIPIPFLYNFSIIGSSLLLGVALNLFQKTGESLFKGVILGILPHSILELSVFIIVTIYAGKINQIIVGKILNKFLRNKKTLQILREQLKETAYVFIFVITPFIFIAALIEGYISRFLLGV